MDVGWVTEASVEATATWKLPGRAWIVTGDLVGDNVVVASTVARDCYLIVLGAVRCRNLLVGSSASLVCVGPVSVAEVMIVTDADAVTLAADKVTARVLVSGKGAWLTLSDEQQLAVEHLVGYVMIGAKPLRPSQRPDLDALVVPEALDTRDWDSLDPADQQEEARVDHVRIHAKAARARIEAGASILRSAP